jgi:hypothetical protein
MKNSAWLLLCSAILFSCTVQKTVALSESSRLKFIGEYDVPHQTIFQNTTVGGLSGIDYDARKNWYYLICDDRSAINPARFYTARIYLNERGIDSVQFVAVTPMRQADGSLYPNAAQDPFHTPDPEAMRYDARKKQLVWSSEGEHTIKKEGAVLEDPSIVAMSTNGNYRDSFALPDNMHIRSAASGPRQNSVFEGLSFTDNYKSLLVSVEEPLYEDGPRAGLGDSSAWSRIIKFKMKTKKPVAQFGYRIDPVAYPATPAGAFKINGVSDILAINDHQLLVLERSFSTGRKSCTIKVFLAETGTAEDISTVPSITNGPSRPISKKLLLNMDSLGIYIDNVEGVTLGPRLPNGHQTLIFVVDNNFSADEITQFLLFEIE